jgi:hypothetical protein
MIMNKALVLGIAIAAAACGGGKDKDAPAAAAAPGFTQGTVDAAACNALVPAPLKDKIVFDKRAIAVKRGRSSVTTYTVAAPRAWKQDMDSFADLKADDKGGFFSRFEVGSNCDGTCTDKDWDKVVDKATFAPMLANGSKVIKDVKGAGGDGMSTRTVIVEHPDNTKTTDIAVAWWKKGDLRYYTCRATLDESVKDAAPAFERACTAMSIDGDD